MQRNDCLPGISSPYSFSTTRTTYSGVPRVVAGLLTEPPLPVVAGLLTEPLLPVVVGLLTEPLLPVVVGLLTEPLLPVVVGLLTEPLRLTGTVSLAGCATVLSQDLHAQPVPRRQRYNTINTSQAQS